MPTGGTAFSLPRTHFRKGPAIEVVYPLAPADLTDINANISNYIANVHSVGSAFKGTPEVKVFSLPETMNEKSTFRLNS